MPLEISIAAAVVLPCLGRRQTPLRILRRFVRPAARYGVIRKLNWNRER